MEVFDRINRRYEKEAIRFAAVGSSREWKGKRATVSPRFTTSWHELLKAK